MTGKTPEVLIPVVLQRNRIIFFYSPFLSASFFLPDYNSISSLLLVTFHFVGRNLFFFSHEIYIQGMYQAVYIYLIKMSSKMSDAIEIFHLREI